MILSIFRKKRTFALLFVVFVIVLFSNQHWLGRLMYPIHYEEEIISSSLRHGVDPLLVVSIIRVESNFRPNLVSSKQAAGLMQIMPETASWIIEQEGLSDTMHEQWTREDYNIYLGTWYLKYLSNVFTSYLENKPKETQMAVVIAAYNAGPGHVSQWLEEGIWDGSLEDSKSIPFGETRHYVSRVMYYYSKYMQVYSEDWGRQL